MPLSEAAIANDRSLGLPLVPMRKIFADPNFNCRGQICAADVLELARDVATRGLVEPIILRKLWDIEKVPLAQGYEFSLIAGFRRHFAYRVNNADCIPAVIREIQSDFECRDINAVENLQRTNLNMLQEAKSIAHYLVAGWNRDDIAKRVNKSPGWVQLRSLVLEMPEEIQLAIAQGYILQDDLKEIYKHRGNRNEMMRLAGIIRDRRKIGQKKNVMAKIKKKQKPLEIRVRKSFEMQEMMELVREVCKKGNPDITLTVGDLFTNQGNSIVTRLLAWCCGNANNIDAHQAIKKLAELIGTTYTPPEFDTYT